MQAHRSLSLTVGAALILLMAVPAVASAQPAAPSAVVSVAASPGDDIELADPALVDAPQVELEGEILVTVAEPPLGSTGLHDDLTSYSVVTETGVFVGITGDIPSGIKSGDAFSGAVAVPQTVVDALAAPSAAVVEASDAASPVAAASAAAVDVLETADAQSTDLPVASGTVAPAELAAAGTAATHTLNIVVINPAGVDPNSYSDADIAAIAAKSTSFWSSASGGRIPSFTASSSISRTASPSGCALSPFDRWNEAAATLGYSTWQAFIQSAPTGVERHLMVVLPKECELESGVGVGTVGSDLHTGGVTQVVLGVEVDQQVMTHELGHNLSLGHSNLDYCDSEGCAEYEYWDAYDVMGISLSGADAGVTALNVRNQVALGFTTVATANAYSLPANTATSTTTVTVGRINGGASPRALLIVDPLTNEIYFVEYRGGESPSFYSRNPGITIDNGRQRQVNFGPGVRLLRDNGDNGSSVFTVSDSAGVNRAAASAGKPMQNTSGSVKISVLSMSEGAGASIQINLSRPDVSQPVYRFWSPKNQTHFYTMNTQERDGIIANYPSSTWTYEGERYKAFATQVAGTVPLYRFWSPRLSGHFFTTNESEKNSVINDYDDFTWTYESIAYYVYPADYTATPTLPVARFWSPTNQHHFYTASAEETAVVRTYPAAIWTFEGYNYRVPIG